MKFEKNNVNLEEYYKVQYNIQLRGEELTQPLLALSMRGDTIYLLPSHCYLASLPDGYLHDKMRHLRPMMITEPADRHSSILRLVESLS